MELELQSEPIYIFNKHKNIFENIGAITGDYYLLNSFDKLGFNVKVVGDTNGTYLIIK